MGCPLLAARTGPTGPVWRGPLLGVTRKWLAEGQTNAIDPKRTLVGPCGRLAKSFLDKSDLVAQAGFGVFAVLDAALDQDRVDPQPSEYDRSWQGNRCWFYQKAPQAAAAE
jgi:hypothetical protein